MDRVSEWLGASASFHSASENKRRNAFEAW
jgi:hypothetical protein